jgi:hypothetical protein
VIRAARPVLWWRRVAALAAAGLSSWAAVAAPRPLSAQEPVASPAATAPAGIAAEAEAAGDGARDEQPAAARSTVSHEVLRRDCRTADGRREVTFFLNGTVRLRWGAPGAEEMLLGELDPARRDGFLRRLAGEDLSEVSSEGGAVEGSAVERCTLALDLPGAPPRALRFSRFDSLALPLARVLAVADELALVPVGQGEQLPAGYRARSGDVLRRRDGQLYEVVGRTADGKGVELQGVDQPITLFVREEDLAAEFEALASRRH